MLVTWDTWTSRRRCWTRSPISKGNLAWFANNIPDEAEKQIDKVKNTIAALEAQRGVLDAFVPSKYSTPHRDATAKACPERAVFA
jgi:hypothetical protein